MKSWICNKGIALAGLLLASLMISWQAMAEDIDLFLGPPTTATGTAKVLIVLDNSTNWNSVFDQLKPALVEVFGALPDNEIDIGIMMFTPSSGGAATSGGYVRAAVRPMTDGATGTKQLYADMINNLTVSGTTSDGESSGKISNTMAEAYAYFAGVAPRSGSGRDRTDYRGNVYAKSGCCAPDRKIWAKSGNALLGKSSSPYQSPVDEGSCAGNYIIFVSNGPTQDATTINNASLTYLTSVRGTAPSKNDLTKYSVAGDGSNPASAADNWADEWAEFMKQESDLAITTFAIDINVRPTNGQGPNMTLLMKSIAAEGGGEYYDLRGDFDPEKFKELFEGILSRILAKNSVFASVALPASAGTSSTFLNQVFVGLFRPDADAKPRWPGNLKQYKLGFDPDDNLLKVVDADNKSIASTDFDAENIILDCARSIWTPPVAGRLAYWEFLDSEGGCLVGGSSADYDTPDGPIVEKGGHAYIMRARDPSTRVVYTCSSSFADCKDDADTLTNLSTNPSATDLGVDAADRTTYLDWLVGYDLDDENDDDSTTDMRPYVHGDVVHSRPVALDYNLDPDDPDIVVFYAANDGVLRAINGNASGTGAGSEYWAFLPPEFFSNVQVLRDNDAEVRFPASGLNAGAGIAKPYGMDGPLATYANDSDDDDDLDEVILYGGMRRGGRVVYAFDVLPINAMPDLKWKVGCPNMANDTDCTTGMSAIGQTWSPISLISASGYDSGDTPLLIMGGGYDDCEDVDAGSGALNHDCDYDGAGGDDDKGNAIYVLDATTGAVLKSFPTARAVAGVVTVVPYNELHPDYPEQIKYAYAADTGGNIYRISGGTVADPADIQATAPASWIMTKIASLGCDVASPSGSDCIGSSPANRKFLFGPDVAEIPGTEYLVVTLGSGDREKPLTDYGAAYSVPNYFYAIVDHPLEEDWLDDGVDNTCENADVVCSGGLTALGLAGVAGLAEGETLSQWGWKFPLANHEQVVSGALTISNDVYFSTHIPEVYVEGACDGDLGDATTYALDYLRAEGDANAIIGGGLPPTPVAGKVLINDTEVPFCIGCGGENSPIGGTEVTGSATWTQPKNRVYWNIEQ